MARASIDVSDLIRKRAALEKLLAQQVLDVTAKLTLDCGARLIEATPVDTNNARSNWEIQTPTKPYEPGIITNNTPYIGVLADGHSPQADDGWVEDCVVAAVTFGVKK